MPSHTRKSWATGSFGPSFKPFFPSLRSFEYSGVVHGSARPDPAFKNLANFVGAHGVTGSRPSPSSAYVENGFMDKSTELNYFPPLRDESIKYPSYHEGIRKYMMPKKLVSDEKMRRLSQVLLSVFRVHLQNSPLLGWEENLKLVSWEKSPGFPFYFSASTKEDAFTVFDMKQIVQDELLHGDQEVVYSTTLKDELRPTSKKARLFTPAPFHATLVGNHLYHEMNNKLANTRRSHPIKLGVTMPGAEFNKLFLLFPEDWHKNHFDISGFDTHVCLSVMSVICWFRNQMLSDGEDPLVQKANYNYYSKTYCGLVWLMGWIITLFGQRSGSTNTFTDNSFYVVAILYECVSTLARVPLDHVEFVFKLTDGSDDAMFAVNPYYADAVNIVTIANYLYKHFGTRLESPSICPLSFEDLYFFSHHLVKRDLSYLGYSNVWFALGNVVKIEEGFGYDKSSNTLMRLQRYAALLLCLFPNERVFGKWRARVNQWIGTQSCDDPVWARLVTMVNTDAFFVRIHSNFSVNGFGASLSSPRLKTERIGC